MSKNKGNIPTNNQLGQKIKMLREQHGMSQYELADAIGCPREKIYRYEAAYYVRIFISLKTLHNILT